MDMNEMKPNYAELARKHEIDWRTVKKYHEGYEGKSKHRNKKSKLDKYADEIRNKINLPGATIKGTHKFFEDIDEKIGTYSNFKKYVKKKKLRELKEENTIHPRYETEYGEQMQFDWKEDIKMISKSGEEFIFNVFSSVLSRSRLRYFAYSKTKTREDVERCLVETFRFMGGVPKELLTDNMSSIVNISEKKFTSEFLTFAKDMNVIVKHCKVRSPETKGKVESQNRFMSWLIPYNHEFETEEELIEILKKIVIKVNKEKSETTGVAPLLLFEKEKEYLQPLPCKEILDSYLFDVKLAKVSNGFLVYYQGSQYSVPPKFINKTVKLRVIENKLHIYYNNELIALHTISNQKINYLEEHYKEGLALKFNSSYEAMEEMAKKNLEALNALTN